MEETDTPPSNYNLKKFYVREKLLSVTKAEDLSLGAQKTPLGWVWKPAL